MHFTKRRLHKDKQGIGKWNIAFWRLLQCPGLHQLCTLLCSFVSKTCTSQLNLTTYIGSAKLLFVNETKYGLDNRIELRIAVKPLTQLSKLSTYLCQVELKTASIMHNFFLTPDLRRGREIVEKSRDYRSILDGALSEPIYGVIIWI